MRLRATAIAARVERRHFVSTLRKIRNLMSPRVPELGKSMNADYQGTFACGGDVEVYRSILHGNEIHDVILLGSDADLELIPACRSQIQLTVSEVMEESNSSALHPARMTSWSDHTSCFR